MTEKRYKLTDFDSEVEMLDFINSREEVIQKVEIAKMEMASSLGRAIDENEQLKEELKSFRPLYFKSEDGYVTLYEKVKE